MYRGNFGLYVIGMMAVALMGALGLAGCGDDAQTIRDQRVVETPAVAPSGSTAMSTGERFGFRRTLDTSASEQAPYAWSAPVAWEAIPSAPLRPANFIAGESGSIEIYLSVLGGTGGGIPANINRWRNQMNLSDLSEEDITALPEIQMLGEEAVLIDFEGQFQGMEDMVTEQNARMLGAMMLDGDQAVFVKLVGPADEVATEYDNFLDFVQSIDRRTTMHAHNHGDVVGDGDGDWTHPPIGEEGEWQHPPIPEGMQDMNQTAFQSERPDGLHYTAPEGWRQDADRPVRLVTYTSGANNEVETYVTILSGNAGGLLLNINRWREEMGNTRLSESDLANVPDIEVLGVNGKLVEVAGNYDGKTGDSMQDAKMIGIVVPLESQVLFARMTGPVDIVDAERENFLQFCQSMEMPGGAV